jgi:hypothetical protein
MNQPVLSDKNGDAASEMLASKSGNAFWQIYAKWYYSQNKITQGIIERIFTVKTNTVYMSAISKRVQKLR